MKWNIKGSIIETHAASLCTEYGRGFCINRGPDDQEPWVVVMDNRTKEGHGLSWHIIQAHWGSMRIYMDAHGTWFRQRTCSIMEDHVIWHHSRTDVRSRKSCNSVGADITQWRSDGCPLASWKGDKNCSNSQTWWTVPGQSWKIKHGLAASWKIM